MNRSLSARNSILTLLGSMLVAPASRAAKPAHPGAMQVNPAATQHTGGYDTTTSLVRFKPNTLASDKAAARAIMSDDAAGVSNREPSSATVSGHGQQI